MSKNNSDIQAKKLLNEFKVFEEGSDKQELTTGKKRPEVDIPAITIGNKSSTAISRKLPILEIDPKRCRPWAHHNRHSDWLNVENCSDLISSISTSGQQEPGLVREIEDNDFDYEIVYGVRRWFACSQIPNQKFTAKLTESNDKECMILMHIENADSKDISDMERAVSFREHIKSGVFKSQKELSKDLNVSDALMTRYMQAASIYDYDWILNYLPPIRSLSIRKAASLSALLKDRYNRDKIKVFVGDVQAHEIDKKTFINRVIKSCEHESKLDDPAYAKISDLHNLKGITSKIDSKGNLLIKVDAKFKAGDKNKAIKQISEALLAYAEG